MSRLEHLCEIAGFTLQPRPLPWWLSWLDNPRSRAARMICHSMSEHPQKWVVRECTATYDSKLEVWITVGGPYIYEPFRMRFGLIASIRVALAVRDLKAHKAMEALRG